MKKSPLAAPRISERDSLERDTVDRDKRRLARLVCAAGVAGGGAVAAHKAMHGSSWKAPVVDSILLPAHAMTSVGQGGMTAQPPAFTGNIRVTGILWRQTASADPAVLVDEYVDLENIDTGPIDIGGWVLGDNGPNFTVTFPSRVLQPGETCRIYVHSAPGLQSCEFSFGRTSPGASGNYVFNNTGDSAVLRDSFGALIDSCTYTGSAANPFSCP